MKVFYSPLSILLPLNILTGTAYAFSISLFFIIFLTVILFNTIKIHRKCFENKGVIVVAENLWILMTIFYCVNQWAAHPITMPYIVL
jgi:hypothetical protein